MPDTGRKPTPEGLRPEGLRPAGDRTAAAGPFGASGDRCDPNELKKPNIITE